MATTTVDIDLRLKLAQFEAQMRKVPNITEREIKAAVATYGAGVKKMEKEATTAFERIKKDGNALGKVAELLGPKWAAAGNALRTLKGSSELASGGISTTTLAVGAAAIGVAALAGGVAAYASIVSGTITNIDSMSASLTQQQRDALGPQLLAVEAAHKAQVGLSQAWTEAQINITAAVAPAYQALTDKLVGVLNAYNDIAEATARDTAEGHKLNVEVAAGTVAYNGLSDAQKDLMSDEALGRADSWGWFWKTLLQDTTVQVSDFTLEVEAAKRAQRALANAPTIDLHGTGPLRPKNEADNKPTFDFAADAMATDKERTQQAIANAKARKDAWDKQFADAVASDSAIQSIFAELDAQIADQLAANAQAGVDAVMGEAEAAENASRIILQAKRDEADGIKAANAQIAADNKALQAKRMADVQDYLSATSSFTSTMGNLADMLAQRQVDATEAGTEAHKKALLKQFNIAKGVAIAQATINTALGFTQDLAKGGVVGIVLGALTLAAGAVEIGMIAAQKPPTYHTGGLIKNASSNRAPDEVDIRAQAGEAMLNRKAVDRLGGERGVNQLNRGGGVGGSSTVVNVLDHKVYDAQSSRSLGRRDSAIARAMRLAGNKQRAAGHRTFQYA